jgi:thymidylate synthase
MQQYHDLMQKIIDSQIEKPDRTGVGTFSLFGEQMRFNLQEGFPLLTTKKIHWKSVVYELLWFLKGDTNISYLQEHGVKIWDAWADENGDLGPIYGAQWRRFPKASGTDFIDQIKALETLLKADPHSRRALVSAWNPGQIEDMALAPCHCLFQFWVDNKNRISCHIYQRSADIFLGVPFNIASYALLTHIVAHTLGFEVGELVWTSGDVHLYKNHINQAYIQLSRIPGVLPRLEILRKSDTLDGYEYEDFVIHGYHPDAAIKAPVAV